MTVQILTRTYKGVPVGNVATFPTSEETALIAQGLASASTAASTTTGAVTQNSLMGKAAIAAAASSVEIGRAHV